ncbi:MAG TPA: HAMP domain-containing sensor histidine kinase [Acidimicrobiales bacterium]|nr:HAMP domain-containing sensor histidine kinase [Acidimicrobiales bacterium]
MVELSRGTALAIATGTGAVVLLLLGLLVRSTRRWRATSRRLAATAARLELPGQDAADDRDPVGRLERQAQAAVLRLSDEAARAERLAGALAQVGAGVVVCDEQGGIAYRNATAPRFEGDAAPPAGDPSGATPAGDRSATDAVRDVLRDALNGDGEAVRTVEVAGPPWRTLRVAGHAIDDGRRVVGGVAIVEDVTEARRLDVVRRDFLANVTAELRSPIGALGLLAGTIVAEDDPAVTRRLAGRLEHDALRVGRIVDDLAELSRLEAEAVPARHVVPVPLLVAQAVEEATRDGGGSAAAVTIDTSAVPDGLVVVGDRRQLVSALRHLVDNALRFSTGAAAVSVTASCAAGWVDVSVADRGPGIAPDELDRIFESFYRSGRRRDRTTAGSGLGLTIASRVAGGHGGRVLVVSEEGAGSTFTLRLPAGERPRTAPAAAEVP